VKPYYERDGITIYHGDCREILAWTEADVLVTDPPYGMSFVSSRTTQRRPITSDHDTSVRDAAVALWCCGRPAAVFGTWKAPRPANTVNRLIWDKQDGVGPGMGDLSLAFGSSDEEIYLLGAWPKTGRRRGNILRTSVGMSALATNIGHPTPKPVGLLRQIISEAPPGSVADPFCGSGSTLEAASLESRRAIGIEIEERYCEIAAKRLSQRVMFGVTP